MKVFHNCHCDTESVIKKKREKICTFVSSKIIAIRRHWTSKTTCANSSFIPPKHYAMKSSPANDSRSHNFVVAVVIYTFSRNRCDDAAVVPPRRVAVLVHKRRKEKERETDRERERERERKRERKRLGRYVDRR